MAQAAQQLVEDYEEEVEDSNPFPLVTDVPKAGDVVYVPDSKEPGLGIYNRVGGWAKVITFQKALDNGNPVHFLYFQAFPETPVRWEGHLDKLQPLLRAKYGVNPAHAKPDQSRGNNYKLPPYMLP